MRAENSFIPVTGVGEATERRLWRQGITHWSTFDPGVLGPTIGERVDAYIETATRHLEAGDPAFFAETFPRNAQWRLYETFREDACFLDIETTGLDRRRDTVTVVSTHRGGETTTLVHGDDLTADRLRAELEASSLVVSFNGRRFDVPFLEHAFGLEVDRPHLDLMYACRRVGLDGGLKAIERELGIDRGEDDISGRDAVRLWHAFDRRGDDGALETLVRYNRDDTVNLEHLADIVTDRLHDTVFESAVTDRQCRLDGTGPPD